MANENVVRGFGALLQTLEEGQLLVDAGDALTDLNRKLARVSDAQGKAKGKITIELNLEAENGVVEITSAVKVTEPKLARERTVLWATKEGHFTGENPKQIKMPLRDVGGGKTEARDVGDKPGEARSV